jgi:hypothetical protein
MALSHAAPLRFGARDARPAKLHSIALAVGVLALIAADAFIITQRDVTTHVGLGQALHQFRDRPASADPNAAGVRPLGESATPGPSRPSAPAPSRSGSTAMAMARPAAPAPFDRPGAAVPFTTPTEGVYAYETDGGESISLGGAHHEYPSTTYATVRHGEGGRWDVAWPIIKEHIDSYSFSSLRGRMLQLSEGQRVTFYGQTDGMIYTADPAQVVADVAMTPNSHADFVFRGTDKANDAQNRLTYLGRERVRVGNTTIDAFRTVIDATLHGKAEGRSRVEMWLHPDTGAVLKMRRTLDSTAHAAFGTVHYAERATFVLRSLAPQT